MRTLGSIIAALIVLFILQFYVGIDVIGYLEKGIELFRIYGERLANFINAWF